MSAGTEDCPAPPEWDGPPAPSPSPPSSLSYLLGRSVLIVPLSVLLTFLWRWRREAKMRLEKIAGDLHPLAMRRVPGGGSDARSSRMAGELELEVSYSTYLQKRASKPGGKDAGGRPFVVTSLGTYLASLEPARAGFLSAREELDAVLGSALLGLLGPRVGPALLPALGRAPLDWALSAAAGLGGLAAEGEDKVHEHEENADHHRGVVHPGGRSLGTAAASLPGVVAGAPSGLSMLSMAGSGDVYCAAVLGRRRREEAAEAEAEKRKAEGDKKSADAESESEEGASGCEEKKSEGGREEKKMGSDEDDDEADLAPDSIGMMRSGDSGDPPFPPHSVPDPFIISEHWSAAVSAAEDELRSRAEEVGGDAAYDPDDMPLGEAVSGGSALLPDLCVGVGGVRCDHTNRRILNNRLLCLLLNRLGTVDVLDEVPVVEGGDGPADAFVVRMDPDGDDITRPCRLIEAMIKCGHKVEARTAVRLTTFGFSLCVREGDGGGGEGEGKGDGEGEGKSDGKSDGGGGGGDGSGGGAVSAASVPSYTHVPLGVLLRTGLLTSTGESIPYFLTHSSIDLTVSGPLLPEGSSLVQFYHDVSGSARWVSGHYPNAPWCVDASTFPLPDPVRAVRVAGLVGCAINSTAVRLGLPLGGYGLIGVCNDSAAIVERTLTGDTGVYPLMGMGGYYRRAVLRAGEIADRLSEAGGNDEKDAAEDARLLAEAMSTMPNDVHPTPSTMADSARRMLKSLPPHPPFRAMVEARRMLREEFGL